ncbi:sodium:solute symporter family transporter [Woeseia oceani]|uniref:Sodium:solute symporter n=1 Tax=Woeseia oceani TaxID=1548547 RepID=A0A193LDF1_9GAMM|nr:sodium/solute symporter [Woeseia oceani]ANO50466.1 hypothetical protein BA177_03900 [Woeseia oceani]
MSLISTSDSRNAEPVIVRRMLGVFATATLVFGFPLLALADDGAPESLTTIGFTEVSELVSTGSEAGAGIVGAYVGVQNGALIVAGGVSGTSTSGSQSSGTRQDFHDRVWVATRADGSDENGDGKIAGDERLLKWHDTGLKLPGKRAYGAYAGHDLGLIAVGGSDGAAARKEAFLIRWDSPSSAARLLQLPDMPKAAMNGGATVLGNSLYVVAGGNADATSHDFFRFDLSRIQTDAFGEPVADGHLASISEQRDEQGRVVSPWEQLPSLPLPGSQTSGDVSMTVAAQNNGIGDRLFVVMPSSTAAGAGGGQAGSSQQGTVWSFDPGASAWTRKADMPLDGSGAGVNGFVGGALGQSHIIVLADAIPGESRVARSYNAVTNTWADYAEVSTGPDSQEAAGTDSLAPRSAATFVNWDGDLMLLGNGVRAGVPFEGIWQVDVKSPLSHFGWPNMTVLVIYLLSMVLIGVYFARKNSDTDDYFRGGQNIPWWAAGCSIYATMLSSLTYLALPALVYQTDWLLYIGILTVLLVAPIIVHLIMPFFRNIDATSAYEYLSKRFNMPVRLFASALFICFQVGRMGIVMALTALALAAVTPLDAWQSVLLMGVLSMLYSAMGGIEAVVWTDTIQVFVLTLGAVLCFVFIISGIDGGLSGFFSAGIADNKFRLLDLDFSASSITSLSIWVIVLGGIGQNMSSYSADQAVVQRYMTTKSTKAAAESIWTNAIVTVPGVLMFFFIGTGLYAYYQSNPAKLDPNLQIDQIFPAFVGAELPIGIAGLIVAGIFAAAQSTVSSGMNSTATALVTDFLRPFNVCQDDNSYLRAARILTVVMGVLGTAVGLLFISPEIRSLMAEYFKVIGMFMGALAGLFILGITTRRATGAGALVGIACGAGINIVVWLMEWANGYLFATIGIACSIGIGYLASLMLPADNQDIDGLTIYTVQRNP